MNETSFIQRARISLFACVCLRVRKVALKFGLSSSYADNNISMFLFVYNMGHCMAYGQREGDRE